VTSWPRRSMRRFRVLTGRSTVVAVSQIFSSWPTYLQQVVAPGKRSVVGFVICPATLVALG
jgi:hypothetical protein